MPRNPRHERFTELLTAHHSQMVGYVFALVGDFNDTQDIVQQACLTLWRKFDEFEPGTDFAAWALAVARHTVLNYRRTQQRKRARFSDSLLAELAAAEEATPSQRYDSHREALAWCIEKLPEVQQRLLWRCYGGKETVKQIAANLGRTTGSVYGSLWNIRSKLLDCIQRALAREGQS